MAAVPASPAAGAPGDGAERLVDVVLRPRRLWSMIRQRRLPVAWFRVLAAVSVVALCLIIVSGAAVRLTGSGLGCPDWPTCAAGNVVAPWQFHAWVEFGNRLITAALSVVVIVAVLGAFVRVRRRRDLTLLSLGLVGGLIAEIVLGGLTVEHKLAPAFVMSHFLLAMIFLADAVVLYHRAGLEDMPVPDRPGRARLTGPAVGVVSPELRIMGAMLLVVTALVVTLGSVVTSTGPHGGSPEAPRFNFSLHDVAQLHGSSVEVYLVFVVVTLALLIRSRAPRRVVVRGEVLLVTVVVQGAIGYTQYFLGVPAGLVEIHVAGAVAVVLAVLRFNLALRARPALAAGPTGTTAAAVAGPAGVGAVPAGEGAVPGGETAVPRREAGVPGGGSEVPATPRTVSARHDRAAELTVPVSSPVEISEPEVTNVVVADTPWKVIVWNDPINLMSYVTFVIQKLFGYSKEKATRLMLDVHTKGKAVVSSGPREKAELDVFRLHEHGLWATMEHDD